MMWRSFAVFALVLSSASLDLADEHTPTKLTNNARQTQKPKKPVEKPQSIRDTLFTNCTGQKEPILPPSITLPVFLWSVRSRMFFQIFPDGTVAANGTWLGNNNAKLKIEVLGTCMVRIRGAHSQRYLVMEENGSLVSQTQPDRRSIFRVKVTDDFYTFENNNNYIAFKGSGQIKKIARKLKYRKSTRFVLIERASRTRRLPPNLRFPQASAGELDRLVPSP